MRPGCGSCGDQLAVEVYLAAGAVTYSRVAAQLDIELLPGGWCFLAAVLLLTMAEAALDRRRIWSALLPNPPLSSDGSLPSDGKVLSCLSCQLIMPIEAAGEPCPRYARRLSIRRWNSLERTSALIIAAIILLYPAYFLPMIVTVQPNGVMERTIFGGVRELFQHGYWYLGVIVFSFSVMIPVLKLFMLSWLTLTVRFPHRQFLLFRMRLHRFVDSINHWSFIDPFIVALNSAMLAFPRLVSASAAAGSLAFSLVVILTMIASRMFDSRLIWDAVEHAGIERKEGVIHA